MEKLFLVIGLGSMGKRRIRNLKANNIARIAGVDVLQKRREEAKLLYNVEVYNSFEQAIEVEKPAAIIISVPPDLHHIYMKKAVELGVPAFIEASVVDDELAAINEQAKKNNIFLAPSSTLFFHPAIRRIKEVIDQGILGKISHIIYHSGQYLPDWHPYEKVSEYYVSNPFTGGAREIVPFELTWLTRIFGYPVAVSGTVKKTITIPGAEKIDDTYNAVLDYDSFILTLIVDVVSRQATRKLLINGDLGQLTWDWNENKIVIYDGPTNSFNEFCYETVEAESGYNKNITEQMYIDEVAAFIKTAFNGDSYVNSLDEDLQVLTCYTQ
jgi:predicted dehydrogenase